MKSIPRVLSERRYITRARNGRSCCTTSRRGISPPTIMRNQSVRNRPQELDFQRHASRRACERGTLQPGRDRAGERPRALPLLSVLVYSPAGSRDKRRIAEAASHQSRSRRPRESIEPGQLRYTVKTSLTLFPCFFLWLSVRCVTDDEVTVFIGIRGVLTRGVISSGG